MKFNWKCRALVTPLLWTMMTALPASAAEVQGQVTQVDQDARVEIQLPKGSVVDVGDTVKIWADIPDVGPAAISTGWTVDSIDGLTVFATPVEPPKGTPKAGYTARIETEATTAATKNSPEQETLDAPFTPEALTFYLRAQDLAASEDPSDQILTAEAFAQAAVMRHPGAMSELGARYSFGRGVERDDKIAIEWQHNAAKLGHDKAMLRLALIHLTGWSVVTDETLGADWVRKAAELGNAEAMFTLAMLYEDGVGVSASMIEMTNWLERAARLGHTQSMFILGHIYLDGEDGVIAKDVYKTEDYWLAAAEAGHVESMRALSEFYEGEAVNASKRWADAARSSPRPPEYTEDLRCLSHWECYIPDQAPLEANPTPVPPVETADKARPERSPRVIYVEQDCDRYAAAPRDPDRVDLDKSVAYSDLDAQRVISECLEDINEWPDTRRFYAQIARGYYKSGLYSEAFEAAMTSAELGSGQGMASVAMMYKNGLSVPEDAVEALRWFEKAGYEGNVTAMHFAAGMHLHAQGVPYNPQAAFRWFQAAADEGNPRAFANLGVLYDNGQGVTYNPQEAAANLVIGLATGSEMAQDQLLQNPNQLTRQTRVEVQRILSRDGLYNGAFDGDFGPKTIRALRARIMN